MEDTKVLNEELDTELEDDNEDTSEDNKETNQENKPKHYVKIREEKAKKSVLKQLGVESVEEAKEKFQKSEDAVRMVEELKTQLANEKKSRETEIKRSQLISLLDSENAFDSEALLNYVELENIELDANNKLKDSTSIISQLKELKPRYFSKEVIKSDSFVKGNANPNPKPTSSEDPLLQTIDYLKRIKNKQ